MHNFNATIQYPVISILVTVLYSYIAKWFCKVASEQNQIEVKYIIDTVSIYTISRSFIPFICRPM